EAEHLTYTYNASGLVTRVAKDCGGAMPCYSSSVSFVYNERGQRIKKTYTYTTGVGTQGSITYYVRDVQGSVMAVYTDDYAVPNIFGPEPAENPVYGSGRLGVYYRAAAQTHYQLTDHLGNVRAVVARAGSSPQVNGATDYYPGGMAMPNRNIVGDYRYNYQGQELDQETGNVAFELRLYDPRINRWMAPDPKKQYNSPYLAMGNNWVNLIDPDGGSATDHWEIDENGNAVLIDTEGDGVWIRNKGEEEYKLISEYNFSSNFGALETITNYYGSNFPLFETSSYGTRIENYKSEAHYRYENGTQEKAPFAYVQGEYNSGVSIFGLQITKPSYSTTGANIVLINGHIGNNANNKWNFTNSLGHEYKHILDNIRVNTLLQHGFNYYNISGKDRPSMELKAIDYQRCLDSWDCTSPGFQKSIQKYQDRFSGN
ncbi:MAG: RHS repeat-associated core domain-containing protein, partial [Flavobacteriaceae bacterium]|nr:RHS repeat-associated core domain-containing protein [Flavobacteriaceae bacterium]